MANELIKLYRDFQGSSSEEAEKIKKKIEINLQDQMRENFLELLEIGGVIGYEKLKEEMQKAIELLDMISGKKA